MGRPLDLANASPIAAAEGPLSPCGGLAIRFDTTRLASMSRNLHVGG
jgi:hypothetical protein